MWEHKLEGVPTQMEKDKFLKIRIDDYTDKKLHELETKYKMTRSEVVRKSIGAFDHNMVTGIFGTEMMDMLLPFDGAYSLISYGIAGKSYLEGQGFWVRVRANFQYTLNRDFKVGSINVRLEQSEIFIDSGFLRDIQGVLAIVYSSRMD